jgi:hypothetical protein
LSLNPKKQRIAILNPPQGCQASTSMAHAQRYVRQNRAEIIGGQLVFREGNHRHQSATRVATMRYDDGLATIDAVKNLPCAGDPVRLFMGKRPTAPVREDRVATVSVLRYDRDVSAFQVAADGRRVYA